MLSKTLANSISLNHHISSLLTHQLSSTIFSLFSTLLELPNKIQLEKIEQSLQSQCKRQALNSYEGMAINIAMSAIVFEKLQEPLIYKQALASLKAKL